MNKFFLSAGLMAIGATSFQAYAEQPTGIIPAKFWNVSGTLRGFYDDNYNVGANKKGSAGFEVSPSVSVNVPLQQTDFGMRYTYGAYYYQQRQDLNLDPFDQTHQLDFWLDHSFNERWKANVNDSFVVGQEPDLLQNNPTTGEASQIRVNGNNIANHGNFKLDTDWTRLFSTSFYYNNSLYDYEQDGTTLANWAAQGASRAGILNRDEQKVGLDLQWHLQPETTAFVGYALGLANYTADEPIAINTYLNKFNYSSDRDSLSHYGYVGVSHQFTPNLTGTVKAGAVYTDSYNDPSSPDATVSPYADVSASYTYLPGSYVQLGFSHDVNATDQVTPNLNNGSMTDYAESSVGYLSVNHRITKKLMGSIIGRCQYSTYEGGLADNETSTDYGLGFNLHYDINQHFGLDAGYNYDHLTSDQNVSDGSYERNRVYIGLMASY